MPSDLTPNPDSALIEAYFKVLAPGIHNVSCGTTLDGGFQITFKLDSSSTTRFLDISKDEYKDDYAWKEKIEKAIEDANV